MGGVELIIFGAGPAIGMAISLLAWLCEERHQSRGYEHYHHDWSTIPITKPSPQQGG